MAYNGPLPQVVNAGGTGRVTLTNHGLLVGAGLSAITQLSAAATGTVLIGNTAADPSFSASPTVTSITISNAPSAGTDGTNKTYVDTAISAVNPSTSVYAATTTNIPGVYLNGVAGIGATFVTTAVGAFTLDGTSPPLLSRILFKDQSTTFQNGVYVLTTNGTGITGSTFTRAVDYNQSSDINSTGVVAVVNGTANQLTGWLLNVDVTNVGVDPITYIQYNSAPISVTQYDVLIGGAANTIVSVGPGSSGQILQSKGNASNPAYSTPTYPSTSGSSGKILISDGTNNIYSTPTYPNTSGTSGKVLISDGTNNIYSTPTFPNASASSGKFIRSDGTNWIASTPTLPTSAGTAGKVLMSDATNYIESTPTYPSASGSTGTILRSDGTNNVYTTATYPATTTINQLLYSSANNVIGQLTTANQGVLTTGATGTPIITALATNGQVIIGSTAGVPAAATLSAGAGISITNGSNSISIAATGAAGGGLVWADVTGPTQTIVGGNGYLADRGGGVAFTLPASSTIGDVFVIAGIQGSWTLPQAANQQIKFGNKATTVGATGSLASTNAQDCIYAVASNTSASSVWIVFSSIGNITVA